MDRFKFRVWEVKKNKYREPSINNADNCIDYLEGKVLYGEGIEIYGEEDDCDVVIEQCTGLKDSNGKLIYEHDILIDHRGDICVVLWDNELASFMLYKTDMKSVYSPIDTDITNFEVIGNIHQNSELLNDNK